MALETPTASQNPTQLPSLVRYQGGPTSSLLPFISEPAKSAMWTTGEGCPRSLEPYLDGHLYDIFHPSALRECNMSRLTRTAREVRGGEAVENASHLAFDLHPDGNSNTCHGDSGTASRGDHGIRVWEHVSQCCSFSSDPARADPARKPCLRSSSPRYVENKTWGCQVPHLETKFDGFSGNRGKDAMPFWMTRIERRPGHLAKWTCLALRTSEFGSSSALVRIRGRHGEDAA